MPRTKGSKNKNINTAKNKNIINIMLILQNPKEEGQEKQQLIQIHKIDHQQAAEVCQWHHLKLL